MEEILPIEEIRERDIDLLLLEEFLVNEEFARNFQEELGLGNLGSLRGAYHSLTQERGESDLVLNFSGADRSGFLVLVENKIDAMFTDRQAERYRERGEFYVKNDRCSQFVTALIAPKSYISLDLGFDKYLTYEHIRDWFRRRGDRRSEYKAMVLDCAIEKNRRGYQRIRHDKVTEFSHRFYEMSQALHPELRFRKPPNDVPKGAGFRYCDPIELKENNIEIVYKFFSKKPFSAVDLQLKGKASEIDDFIASFEDKLEDGMEIVKVSKSIAVRFKLQRLDTTGSFEDQRDDLLLAINYAKRLYDWALCNLLKR